MGNAYGRSLISYSEFMVQCNIEEAASQLSELADKAANGEEIIFTKGTEQFQIVRVPKSNEKKPVRQPGTGGKIWMSPVFYQPF